MFASLCGRVSGQLLDRLCRCGHQPPVDAAREGVAPGLAPPSALPPAFLEKATPRGRLRQDTPYGRWWPVPVGVHRR